MTRSEIDNDAGRVELSPHSGETEEAPEGGAFYRTYVLTLLCFGFFLSYADRQVIGVLLTPIKQEFALSDTELGLMSGLVFGIFYSIVSLPLAYVSDRGSRKVVLTVSLALWSLATMTAGLAASAGHLVASRTLVAVGEAGGTPASISAISDMYPPEQRGMPIGLYNAAGSIGGAVVLTLGAWLATSYGWRSAFIVVGAPGLFLALLLLTTMREPQRGVQDGQGDLGPPPTFMETLRCLWRQPILLLGILGGAASSGVVTCLIWFPSLFERSHQLSLLQAGGAVGIGLLVSGPFGEIIGGQINDRAGRRSTARTLYAVMGITLATILMGVAVVLSPTATMAIALMIVWKVLATVWVPPTWALSQALVEPRMRATSQATMGLTGNLLGYGGGTALAGWLSEAYRPAMGEESLRWALVTVFLLVGLLAATAYFFAARLAARQELVAAGA